MPIADDLDLQGLESRRVEVLANLFGRSAPQHMLRVDASGEDDMATEFALEGLGLVAGLTSDFVEWGGLERAINYGLNKVRFMQMVPEGSRVRARTVVKSMRKRAGALQCVCIHTIEIEGEIKPACRAETIGLYFISGL